MHVFFLDINRIRKILFIALMGLLVTGYFGIYHQTVQTAPTSAKLYPIYEVDTKKKVVALTFDISWGDKTPGPVLDILKKNKIKATFFLSGPWVKQHPEIAKRIARDGHEIASHGQLHQNYSGFSKEKIKSEIALAEKSIKQVTGKTPRLIRTPNGDYSNHVIEAIRESGYQAIQWGTDSLDWMNPGVDKIINRVTTKVHPGDIILMHASDSCKQTHIALPVILKQLKKENYKFVFVSEILKMGPHKP